MAPIVVVAALALVSQFAAKTSYASCNLIPTTERLFGSTLGGVTTAIVTPGTTVDVVLRPECDVSLGFDANAGANQVTLTFVPASGPVTEVIVDPASFQVADADDDGFVERLSFELPDTDDAFPPLGDSVGLSGPATILVRRPEGTTVADIGLLYQPTASCDRSVDPVFREFTVLPPPNVLKDIVNGTASAVYGTLDGNQNLLIPLDYEALLPADNQIALLLKAVLQMVAFTNDRCENNRDRVCSTNSDCAQSATCLPLAGSSFSIPTGSANISKLVRSFTVDGRPLPPLLRIASDGHTILGTADAKQSTLRFARTDGELPELYDLTDRLIGGNVIFQGDGNGFSVATAAEVFLPSLRSSANVIAYTRSLDGAIEIVDLSTGGWAFTEQAVAPASTAIPSAPALEVSDEHIAFVQSEEAQGTDVDGSELSLGFFLRVYDRAGSELTSTLLPAVPVPAVNRAPLAMSQGKVFYRQVEGTLALVDLERDVSLGGTIPNFIPTDVVVSADGEHAYVIGRDGSAWFPGCVNGTCPPESERPYAMAQYRRDLVTGQLSFVTAYRRHEVTNRRSATISPDGRHLYVGGETPQVGNCAPAVDECLTCDPADVGVDCAACELHPNCTQPCLGGDCGVEVWARNLSTGALTYIDKVPATPGDDTPLISPDGAHAYKTGGCGCISAFARDPVDGLLSGPLQVACHGDPFSECSQSAGLGGSVMSPDGKNLYTAIIDATAVGRPGGIARFDRDPVTGLLTYVRTIFDGDLDGTTVVDGLLYAKAVTVSPDGNNVYVLGSQGYCLDESLPGECAAGEPPPAELPEDAVVTFDRDTNTGALTFREALRRDDAGLALLASPSDLKMDPRGHLVYVAASGDVTTVLAFNRDRDTGLVTFAGAIADETSQIEDLALARRFTLSPDGADLYLPSDPHVPTYPERGVAVLRVSARLQAFDLATRQPAPGLDTPRAMANVVAVAEGRAALVTPERTSGGLVSNGDADDQDLVVQLYDAASDTLTDLGIGANRVAMSADLLAVTQPEASENQPPTTTGADKNHDGDSLDDILLVGPADGSPEPQSLDVAADDVAVVGPLVFFVTPEANEPATGVECELSSGGGCDLNGDGDAVDRVLRVYDGTTGLFAVNGEPIRKAIDDFVAGDKIVAFRVNEAAQGAGPLNGDDDIDESVLQLFDVASGTVIDTGQSAIRCDFPGCVFAKPYGIAANQVTFLTDEEDQGEDLDGDGLVGGIIRQVATIVDSEAPPAALAAFGGASSRSFVTAGTKAGVLQRFHYAEGIPPFPVQLTGDRMLIDRQLESEAGRDLDDDGDMDGAVGLVAGDADNDGAFNENDSCVETPNPDQSDDDGDALGNACEPDRCERLVLASTDPAPESAVKCRTKLAKAALKYLKVRHARVAACLKQVLQGKLFGDATTLCRGRFVGNIEILPEHAKTREQLLAARQKFEELLTKACSPAETAEIYTCAGPNVALADCVRAAHGQSVNAATEIALGEARALQSPTQDAQKKCLLAFAKGSRGYLRGSVLAMQRCLARIDSGDVVGDSQETCLGALDHRCVGGTFDGASCCPDGGICNATTSLCVGGANDGSPCAQSCDGGSCDVVVVLPSDSVTNEALRSAESKLRSIIGARCLPGALDGSDVCAGGADAEGHCLLCSHYSGALRAIQSVFGP